MTIEWVGGAIEAGKLLFALGAAVVEAVQAGETTKTVGEIFEGVRSDMSEIERLELARFGPEQGRDPGPPLPPGPDPATARHKPIAPAVPPPIPYPEGSE